ncbi:unnamed protein product [Closterium sp. NIES-54]
MVTTTTPGGQRVSICTCTRTGRHLATFTRRPGSSLYTLTTEPAQLAAFGQVSTSLPPLVPSPALPCLPCVEGRQCATPHSSSFPPTAAPLQTLHMDVWGLARSSGQGRDRYFLLVIDDYTCYTTAFLLRSKGEVSDVLIPWICTVRLQLRERFHEDLPVPRLHSDRGVMEVVRTSMILAATPLSPYRDLADTAFDREGWRCVGVPGPGLSCLCPRYFRGQALLTRHSLRPPPIDPLPPQGPAPSGAFQVDPLPLAEPVEVTVDSGAARVAASGGAEPAGAELGGAKPASVEPGGAEPEGAEPGGAETEGAEPGGAESEGAESRGQHACNPSLGSIGDHQWTRSWSGVAGARGPTVGGTGAGGAGATSPGGAGVIAGAGGTEGAGATGLGGAGGTEGAGAGGVGGAGGGDPGAGGAGAGGIGPGDPGAGGTGAGDPGAVGTGTGGAGGAGARGAGVGGTGAGGAGVGGAGAGGAGAGGASTGGARAGGAGAGGTRAGGPGAGDLGAGGASAGGAGAGGTGAGGTLAGDPGARGAGAGGTGAGSRGTGVGGAGVGGAGAGGAGARGAGAGGAVAGDPRAGGAGTGGAGAGGTGAGGTVRWRPLCVPPPPSSLPPPGSVLRQVLSLPSSTGLTPRLLCPPSHQSQPQLHSDSPLPAPSPYTEHTDTLAECRKPASHPALPVCGVCTCRRVPCPCPRPVPGTHIMALRPSSDPLRVPLPSPPVSSLAEGPDPESDLVRAASPTVTRLLATVVTDPSFESVPASALFAELVDFAAACRLDYAASLVAEYESDCPPSTEGECALGTDVFEDKQEDFECLSATIPHLLAMLLAPEGDPDAPDIPTPRSYTEAITGPYSSQWQTVMDAEMASWKSTGTYIDVVPPPRGNIVDGMWIFRVKRPPKFSACLQGSLRCTRLYLHEEIWLRRPPGFTGLFPTGTLWSLWRPVYGLRQAPREWHDTLRMTLAVLGFAPSTVALSLFLRTDTSLPPFCILVFVDDLFFATADTEALTLVKSELQKRHTCTDLGELRSYLGLKITRDKARRTITLTQSHMVHQVLKCFGFRYSSP